MACAQAAAAGAGLTALTRLRRPRDGLEMFGRRPPRIAFFNAKRRLECLDQHWFTAIKEAEEALVAWRQDDHTYAAQRVGRIDIQRLRSHL